MLRTWSTESIIILVSQLCDLFYVKKICGLKFYLVLPLLQ